MRAAVVSESGQPLTVTVARDPEPAAGELLVSVEATSINPIDMYVASGQYPLGDSEYPLIPGHDFAGRVERVGDGVTAFAAGDRVLGMWSKDVYRDGSWAERVVVPADGLVARWPDGLAAPVAAALPLAALTAALSLAFVAPVAGEPLVVIGAAGAVGRYAVQLAGRAGADITATARAGGEAAARALGASETVDPGADLAAELQRRFPRGVPAVIDLVSGRRTLARISEVVGERGRLVSARHAADPGALADRQISALNVRAYDASSPMLAELADAAAAGELSVALDHVVEFDQLPEAVAELAAGTRVGRVAVTVTRS